MLYVESVIDIYCSGSYIAVSPSMLHFQCMISLFLSRGGVGRWLGLGYYYWDTCGGPVIKCLCFFVFFFFFFFFPPRQNGKIAQYPEVIGPSTPSRGHWALDTMTTNCDPMRCSHADRACYSSTP